MFLICWKSEPQRSYKHGSYKKKGCKALFPIGSLKEFFVNFLEPNPSGFAFLLREKKELTVVLSSTSNEEIKNQRKFYQESG